MNSSPLPPSFERHELLQKSLSLSERLELGSNGSEAADSEIDSLLLSWNKAFSPSDPAALARRLSWDGIDRKSLKAALSGDLDVRPDAHPWIDWVYRILDRSRELASKSSEQDESTLERDDETRSPFLELWAGAVEVARDALGAIDESDPVKRRFEQQLSKALGSVSELALYEHYRAHWVSTERGDSVYRAFIHDMLSRGLGPFFTEYPVLARQVGTIVGAWVETTRELLERLAKDREALAELLSVPALGALVDVEPALSDPHLGLRRVARLHFESGVSVVYKPRDMCIERDYNDFLQWAADEGLENAPPRLEVLCRSGYGYVRAAKAGEVSGRPPAARYFERAGALVFIAHLLNGRDFHMENVVASEAGPVLVDPEMLLQPILAGAAEAISDDEDAAPLCTETGILSLIESGPEGRIYDVGGLNGEGDVPSAIRSRVWKNHGTAELAYEEIARSERPPSNRIRLSGAPQSASSFSSELLSGFVHAYRFFVERREEVGERLGKFRQARVRILVRPTSHYAMASRVLREPKYQRSGTAASLVLEALHRGFANQLERPRLWPAARHETKALSSLDIPRFDVGFGETRLLVPGETDIDGHFARSGEQAVRSRLEGLGDKDLVRQARALFEAAETSVGARFAAPRGRGETPFLSTALWIAEELSSREKDSLSRLFASHGLTRQDEELRRFHLYDGLIGESVFFAALASVTGDRKWRELSREVPETIAEALSHPRSKTWTATDDVGACSGSLSVVHGLALVGRLTGEDAIVDLAFDLARRVSTETVGADDNVDVVSGSAGAILVLAALLDLRSEPHAKKLLDACGARLLSAATADENGRAWLVHGRVLAGFGHGAAGIGLSFVRAFERTKKEEYLRAAEDAYRSERRLYSPAQRNWPLAGGGMREVVMTAWCNGAPGIALGRTLGSHVVADASVAEEIGVALEATARASTDGSDHLCCGNLGRADVLLTVGRLLAREDVVERANEIARAVVGRAKKLGHFRLRSSGFSYPIHSPKFFRGLPGIGYQLVRMEAPSAIPSVLAFEAAPEYENKNSRSGSQ